ncbi:hypothetical protein LEP1GSC116_2319 [Leptospira interrogans serovar Icterohaemorrhagiae str. Verdun HP]|uniref:BolA family transcriptional regulator n=1 Tax=Leptospira interrogans serovar Icterohaemorrhagiae str. Verdun HP TaxID=1049910 RepID=M6REC2_LEPIR|nr:hypothetical protein LEP1GSC116_2319 [Leptospira interrogans serovar Icterohaemorrhagiae str. Verdun HP]
MSFKEEIRSQLISYLNPTYVEVEDFSAQHSGHIGNPEN